MPLCQHQIELRKTRISASDAGAILGLNPWRSAADVQAEKLYQLHPLETTEEIEIGNMLERPLLLWGAARLNVSLRPPEVCPLCTFAHEPTVIDRDHEWLCATPDAAIVGRRAGLEAKTSGIVRGWSNREDWGEEGSAEIPPMYLAQTYVQMAVLRWDVVHVPAMLAGRGRLLYEIPRENLEIAGLIDLLHDWWRRHIKLREPVAELPSLETLKRIVRRPKSVAQVAGELHEKLVASKELLKAAELAEEEARAAYLAALGDAEAGESPAGTFTYFRQGRKSIDAKKLREEYPDAAAACESVREFPVLRLKRKENQ